MGVDLPSIGKSDLTPLGEVTIKEELIDFGREFKRIGLLIKEGFYHLARNEKKALRTRYQIKHLDARINLTRAPKEIRKCILVSARNIPQLKFFQSKEAEQSLIQEKNEFLAHEKTNAKLEKYFQRDLNSLSLEKKVLTASPLTKDIAQMMPLLKKGVCSGACGEFANELLSSNESSFLSDAFLLEIANKYKKGVDQASVVNHFIYKGYPFIPTLDISLRTILNQMQSSDEFISPMKHMLEFILIHSMIPDQFSQERFKDRLEYYRKNQNSITNEISEYIGIRGVLAYQKFVEIVKHLRELNQLDEKNIVTEMNKILVQYEIDGPGKEELKQLATYSSQCLFLFLNYYPSTFSFSKPISAKTNNDTALKTLYKQFIQLISQKEKKDIDLPKLYLKRLFDLETINITLKPRNLKLVKNIPDDKAEKNDHEILQQIKEFAPGVYSLSFYTATGGHATLFIKTDEGNGYFWDPNFGLMKCDNDHPEEIILKVLSSMYECPYKDIKDNHFLEIHKYERIS